MNDRVHRNALQPGYKLHWYEIKSILGQGGFGITYLAYDLNLEREVAIKEYMPTEFSVREGDSSVHPSSGNTTAQFEWGLDRFIQEARTLSRFEHPNIVRVHAVFEENNTGYMVMPYEKGHSLQTILSSKKTLNEATLLHLLEPLLDGLVMIHQSGFIHRDIKPDNIFIREDGSPVLLDFGSARQAVAGNTKTLTTLVSPGYAPFEQYYSKSDEQGPWTDIYGLGATLYRAIAGRTPMDAVDRSKSMLDGSKDNFVSAVEIGKGRYTDEFLQAIDHAIRFKQTERPQTVHAWQAEMKFGEDGVATEMATNFDNFTAPQEVPEAELQNKGSSSGKSLLLAGSALLLAAGGAFFYFNNQQPAPGEQQGQPVAVQASDLDKQQQKPALLQPESQPLAERPAVVEVEADRLAAAQASAAAAEVEREKQASEAERLARQQQQRALEDERRAQAQRELELEKENLAAQRRKLDEELALKKEQERLAELDRQKQQQAAQRKAEQQRIAEEQQRLAAAKKRLAEEKAAVEAARLQALDAEKQRQLEEQQRQQQRLAEEQRRQAEEQRLQAEQQRLRRVEQERRIAASRQEFARRSAETRDKMGYLDPQKPRDLASVAGQQVTSSVSSAIENWQGVGVAIKRGKTYQISASGEWSPGPLCNKTDPTGENMYTITCWDLGYQIVAKRSHAALIGKIGQQNLAFYIGNEFTFTADTDGSLYMMANDAPGFFFDNKGALQVTVSLLE